MVFILTKTLKRLGLYALGMTCLFACRKGSFLDQTVISSLDEITAFSDSANALAFLNNIYLDIGFAQDPKHFSGSGYAAGLEAASDESEAPSSSSSFGYIQFVTGTVNPSVVSNDAWWKPYKNIRAVNQFLRNLNRIPFSQEQKRQSEAEARFLRAWYYTIMIQHYGGVPLIGDTVYSADSKISAQRNTFSECVDYILSECDFAAGILPNTQVGLQYGRISRGAALALKSRVTLFAASPLFNNGGLANGGELASIVAYPDSDQNRWRRAVEAAEAVIGLNVYKHHIDSTFKAGEKGFGFQDLFMKRYNEEYIVKRMMGTNKYLESLWDVPSRGGSGGAFPYQEFVDAFPMANGLPITDPSSGFDAMNPYKNRDPRLT